MCGGGRGEVKVVSVGPRGQQIAGWPAATYSSLLVSGKLTVQVSCGRKRLGTHVLHKTGLYLVWSN